MAENPERGSFIYTIRPSREGFTPETTTEFERERIGAHWEYLQAEHAAGNVIFVGRTMEAPYVGLVVFEADDLEAAKAFMAKDAAVDSGVFLGLVQAFSIALIRK